MAELFVADSVVIEMDGVILCSVVIRAGAVWIDRASFEVDWDSSEMSLV